MRRSVLPRDLTAVFTLLPFGTSSECLDDERYLPKDQRLEERGNVSRAKGGFGKAIAGKKTIHLKAERFPHSAVGWFWKGPWGVPLSGSGLAQEARGSPNGLGHLQQSAEEEGPSPWLRGSISRGILKGPPSVRLPGWCQGLKSPLQTLL